MKHTKVTGRLENWRESGVYKGESILFGNIYDDAECRFQDGTYIHTSGIQPQDLEEGKVVTTRNSTYLLGKPFNNTGE